MKRYLLFILALTSLTLLVGCKENVTDSSIDNLKDFSVSVGTEVPAFLDIINQTGVTVDSSALNMDELGVYPIIFTYTNGENIITKSINVTVIGEPIDEHPIIIGAKPLIHFIGEEIPNYLDGVSALDNKYGDLTYIIDVNDDDVNYNVIGEYDVVYHVVNSDGYHYQKTCIVTVSGADVVGEISMDFFIVEDELGKQGIISNTGEVVIENTFLYIENYGDGIVLLVNNEDAVSFYNTKENIFFQLDFEWISYFDNGYAVVESENGKYAYVNLQGELVTDFVYGYAENFVDGYAIVNRDGDDFGGYDLGGEPMDYPSSNNYGVIDENFDFVIPSIYDDLRVLTDNIYLVAINNNKFIINIENERLFEIDDFYYQTIYLSDETELLMFTSDNKAIYLNEDISLYFDSNTENFTSIYNNYYLGKIDGETVIYSIENKTTYKDVGPYRVEDNYLYYSSSTFNYLIDLTDGKLLLNTSYNIEGIYNEENGLYQISNSDGYFGITSKNGTVFPCKALSNLRYTDEPERYQTYDYKYGYLGKDGTPITSDEYFYVSYFQEGYAYFKESINGLVGVIDIEGNVVIEPTYKSVSDFNNGIAIAGVDLGEGNVGYRFIDTNNNIVSSNIYSQITYYSDFVYKVKDLETGKYGVVNQNDETLIPVEYISLNVDESFAVGALETAPNDYALIDFTGTVLSPFELDSYIKTYDQSIVLSKDDKFGVLDSEGNTLVAYFSTSISGVYDNTYIVAKLSHGYYSVIKDSVVMNSSFYSSIEYLQEDMFAVTMSSEYSYLFDARTNRRSPNEFKNIDDYKDNKTIAENVYGNEVVIDRIGNYLSYESDSVVLLDNFVFNEYNNNMTIRHIDKTKIIGNLIFDEEYYDEVQNLGVASFHNDYALVKIYFDLDSFSLVKLELILEENIYTIDNDKSISLVESDKTISDYDYLEILENNYFVFEIDGARYLYDENLTLINDNSYDFYYQSPDLDLFLVTFEGNYGLIDLENNELLSPIYDEIVYIDGNTFIISIGNFVAIYDIENGFITDFIYSNVDPVGFGLSVDIK